MRNLIDDLAQSFRLLWRQPGFAIAALLLLALGIGLTSGIFSVVKAVLLEPLPFKDSDRIYQLWTRNDQKARPKGAFSAAEFLSYRAQMKSFSTFSAFRHYRATWTEKGIASRVSTLLATEGYLETLAIQPVMGRSLRAEDYAGTRSGVVVLSHGFWTERMGRNPNVIGKPVVLDGLPHTIVGVLPPVKSELTTSEVYVPEIFGPEELAARSSRYLYAIAKLKPGVSEAAAESEIQAAAAGLAEKDPEFNSGWTAYLVEAKEEIVGDSRKPVLVLFTSVFLVLLVACANLANLFLVRLSGRQRDIAVRSALGASQSRIFAQLLMESLWVAVLGGLAGLAVAYATLKAVVRFSPAAVARLENAQLDWQVAAFALLLSGVSGVLFGIGPALKTLRGDLASSLRDESRSSTGGRGKARGRSLLVVAEVAVSVILLVSAGLLARTFAKLAALDMGFEPAGVFTALTALPDTNYHDEAPRREYVRRALEKLRAIPGVQAAGVGTNLPMQQQNWLADVTIEGRENSGVMVNSVSYHAISPGYLEAIGARAVRGRLFSETDSGEAAKVVLVNQAFERAHFPGESSVGRALRVKVGLNDFRAEIVGVVKTVTQLKPEEPPRPAIYQPHDQNPWPFLAFAVRTRRGDPGIAAAMRRAFADVDASLPVDRIVPLVQRLGDVLEQRRLAFGMIGTFGGLAVLLSLVGLYSILAISVAQRRRELGIRMAMGAHRQDLVVLVLRQGCLLAATGVVAGLTAAPLASRALGSMLVGVEPADPLTYVAVALVVMAAAALASLIPAWRGSAVDPMEALREV